MEKFFESLFAPPYIHILVGFLFYLLYNVWREKNLEARNRVRREEDFCMSELRESREKILKLEEEIRGYQKKILSLELQMAKIQAELEDCLESIGQN